MTRSPSEAKKKLKGERHPQERDGAAQLSAVLRNGDVSVGPSGVCTLQAVSTPGGPKQKGKSKIRQGTGLHCLPLVLPPADPTL